jgi:hypothetical protein
MTVKTWFISGVAAALILIPLQNAQAWESGSSRGGSVQYYQGGQNDSQRNRGYSGDSGYDRGHRGDEGRGYSGGHGYYGRHDDYRHHGDNRRPSGGYYGGHHGYYGGDSVRRPMDQPER